MLESELFMGVCLLCFLVFCVFCKYIYYGVFFCEIKGSDVRKLIEEYFVVFREDKELLEKCYGK